MNTVLIDNKLKVASFDIDCQYTFTSECPDELPVPNAKSIVSELNAQAYYAAWRLGSKDAHSPQAIWVANQNYPQFTNLMGENVDQYWNAHAVPGTKGFELIVGLPKITEYNFFVWKGIELDMHPYGSCYHDYAEKLSTGAIEFLLSHQITTIIVGGLATDHCVKHTVLQLLKADFKVIVNLAACRGINLQTTQQAIELMRQAGAQFINCAAQLQNKE